MPSETKKLCVFDWFSFVVFLDLFFSQASGEPFLRHSPKHRAYGKIVIAPTPSGAVSICHGFLTVCSFSLAFLSSKPKETLTKSCDRPRDVVDT